MADKSKIGKEFPPFTWEVASVKGKELMLALGDNNPIYTDRKAALDAGYQDLPAPPTYLTLPLMWNNMISRIIQDLGVDFFNKTLHGEEEYEYFEEIYPGDVLTGSSKIADIIEKSGKGKKMNLIVIETVYTNQKDEKVASSKSVMIERV